MLCSKPMTFKQMTDHLKSCDNLDIPCHFQNCKSQKKFKNLDELKSHLIHECESTRMRCKYCKIIVRRKDIDHIDQCHDFDECSQEI